jgi:hypothetical protein
LDSTQFPHISIQRHEVGLYEWSLLYGNEKFDGEAGDSNIEACLSSAISSIPDTERLVEISYRGIHMGTFQTAAVLEKFQDTTKRIVEAYATLIQDA